VRRTTAEKDRVQAEIYDAEIAVAQKQAEVRAPWLCSHVARPDSRGDSWSEAFKSIISSRRSSRSSLHLVMPPPPPASPFPATCDAVGPDWCGAAAKYANGLSLEIPVASRGNRCAPPSCSAPCT
jgi:hypothetical protein